jgi:branched-chain amino acid transport system ATP-binding protein
MALALETRNLSKTFGGIKPTDNISLAMAEGERRALIGPNGAGKTTLINLMTGVLTPSAGMVLLGGRDITRLAVHARARLGLIRTFQINQLFATLTPLETIGLAVSERLGHGHRWWSSFGNSSVLRDEACTLLERFRLVEVMKEETRRLPYGKQRLLEIAVAIAAKPRVLLLDEPAAGVPEAERDEILATIARLPRNVTVLLIEHDMDLVFRFAQRITVLVNGAVLMEGTAEEVASDQRVRTVYLGEGDHL